MDFGTWSVLPMQTFAFGCWIKSPGEMTEKRVVDAYLKVWNLGGSQNKKVAEMEHLDFLKDAYSALRGSEKVVK